MGPAMLMPLWMLIDGGAQMPATMGLGEWAMLAFVLVSYLEVYLYFYLPKTGAAVRVSYGCFVSLLAGFIWGVVLLQEQYRTTVMLAVGLVVLGLCLIAGRMQDIAETRGLGDGLSR